MFGTQIREDGGIGRGLAVFQSMRLVDHKQREGQLLEEDDILEKQLKGRDQHIERQGRSRRRGGRGGGGL